MQFYFKPEIKTENIFPCAHTQYGFVVTAEGCPALNESRKFKLAENILQCTDDLEGFKTQNVFSASITCLNIEGTYIVTPIVSAAEFGRDLACSFGQSVAVPYNVSPELPADCVVETFTELGSTTSFDSCSAQ